MGLLIGLVGDGGERARGFLHARNIFGDGADRGGHRRAELADNPVNGCRAVLLQHLFRALSLGQAAALDFACAEDLKRACHPADFIAFGGRGNCELDFAGREPPHGMFDGEKPHDQFALHLIYRESGGDDAGEYDEQQQHAAVVDVFK